MALRRSSGPPSSCVSSVCCHFLGDRGDLCCRFAERVFALLVLGDVEKKPRLFELGAMLFPSVDHRFESGLFLEDRSGLFRRRSRNPAGK